MHSLRLTHTYTKAHRLKHCTRADNRDTIPSLYTIITTDLLYMLCLTVYVKNCKHRSNTQNVLYGKRDIWTTHVCMYCCFYILYRTHSKLHIIETARCQHTKKMASDQIWPTTEWKFRTLSWGTDQIKLHKMISGRLLRCFCTLAVILDPCVVCLRANLSERNI